MKRLLIFLILVLVCALLALWSPWLYLKVNITDLFGIKRPDEIASLQVYSLSGSIDVLVDGKSAGTAKVENSPFIVDRITPGEHLITLKRESDIKNAYWDFSKLITFEANTAVIASYNLGPEEEFSEGQIIYAIKKVDKSKTTQLNISVNTEKANVQIDNAQPLTLSAKTMTDTLSINSQHQVVISKKGYENLSFTILPESQEDRDKLKDFDLNIEAHLMLQPATVE